MTMTNGGELLATDATTPRRRRWRWVLLAALIVVLLALLGLAVLPTLLSSGLARRLVMGRVNRAVPGQIEVAGWSLGWFSGFRFTGIAISDPDGARVVEIGEIKVGASVPGLLGGIKRLGTVSVTAPRLDLVIHDDGSNNLQAALVAAHPGEETARRPKKEKRSGPPLAAAPLAVVGELAVRDGEIRVRVPGVERPLLVSDLNLDLHLDEPDQPIRLALKFLFGENRAIGELNTQLSGWSGELEHLATATTLNCTGLDLAELSPLLRLAGVAVTCSGMIDGKLSVQTQGQDSVQAEGQLSGRDLAATGGQLGEDHPRLDTVTLAFDLAMSGRELNIAHFVLSSPLATADAYGKAALSVAGGIPDGDLKIAARIKLADLAAQLPRMLRLHAGMKPVAGELAFDARLASAAERATITAALRLEDLAALHAGRRVELDRPIIAAVKASFSGQGPEIETLSLSSSFVNATGQGNLDNLTLTLTSDLAALSREIAKFADLGAVGASGTADLQLNLRAAADDQSHLDSRLTLTGLDLSGITPRPVKLSAGTVTLRSDLAFDPDRKFREFRNLQAGLSTPFMEAAGQLGRLTPVAGDLPEIEAGKLGATADLAELSGFAAAIGVMPPTLELAGQMRFATDLAINAGTVAADRIDLDIVRPEIKIGDQRFADDRLTVRGHAAACLHTRTASLREMVTETAGGKFTVVSLTIPDWSQVPQGLEAEFTGQAELARLLAAAGGFIPAPPEFGFAGGLSFSGTAAMPEADRQRLTLDAKIAPLTVTRASQPWHREDQVTLRVAADVATNAGRIDVPTLAIASRILRLDAKLALADLKGKRTLDANGDFAFDGDLLGPLAAAFSGQPITLGGQHQGPFRLTTSLAAGDWRERLLATDAEVELRLARAGYADIIATDLVMPLIVRQGLARTDARGLLGGGEILLPATVDARPEPPTLTLPPDTMLLREVNLSNEVVNMVVAKFLPIFTGVASADGKVGLLARQCRLPLAGDIAGQASFDGTFAFSGGRLDPTGFLREALVLAGLEQLAVNLPDQEVVTKIQDGRLFHERLELRVGGHPVGITGGIILARQQLDYQIELPITRALVGGNREILALLADETIRLHITGPVAKPRLDRDSFQKNLTRLTRSVGKRLLEQKGGELLRRGLRDLLESKE